MALVLAVDLALAVEEELAVQPSHSRAQSLETPVASMEDPEVEESPVAPPATQAILEVVCGASRVASLSGSFASAVFQELR